MEYASAITPAISDTDEGFAAHVVSLVGSRLCHDLVSPLGAIGNGVELLQMAGDWPGFAGSPEMRLIEDALKAARARINGFRMAFGAAGGTQRVPATEFAALVRDIQNSSRLQVRLEAEGDHARGMVKLVLLALMCMETAMPWGARVTISQQGRDWCLKAEAERTRQDSALWSWLDGQRRGKVDATASEVHFLLLPLAAAEMQRSIFWDLYETGAEIRF